MSDQPNFVCPRCRGPLVASADRYECAACVAIYPIVFGIPDFRVEPDPWISIEDDRAKAARLLDETQSADFADSVAAYWAMTPNTPRAQAERFTRHVLEGEARASEWLDTLGTLPSVDGRPSLEIGCASGDLLAAARARGIPIVGVDVAMRWLVLARKRPLFRDGSAPTLVCANGEFLPFANDTLANVFSMGTLEHCRDAASVLRESVRVMSSGGALSMRTTNRYTMLAEPHVNVWGVGFVPRSIADRYVRSRGGQGYVHHRPLSVGELARFAREAGAAEVHLNAAPVLPTERARLSGAASALVPFYDAMRRVPLIGGAVRQIAPVLELRGTKS